MNSNPVSESESVSDKVERNSSAPPLTRNASSCMCVASLGTGRETVGKLQEGLMDDGSPVMRVLVVVSVLSSTAAGA